MYRQPSIIRIKNLRLRTYVGFNPEEQEKRQDVVINAAIQYDASVAACSDCVEATLDYKRVTKSIIQHVEEHRFLLLERLCEEVLELIMVDARVIEARVEIDKPHALRFADSVSVTHGAARRLPEARPAAPAPKWDLLQTMS